MSKFHINIHGVPAPCKATKGNCPRGGASGTDNHFDTAEEAQAAADRINSAEFGQLPGVSENKNFSFGENHLETMKGTRVKVEYGDGKEFEGEVIGSHYDPDDDGNTGVIIKNDDGEVKHIKSRRMTDFQDVGQEKEKPAKERKLTTRDKEFREDITKKMIQQTLGTSDNADTIMKGRNFNTFINDGGLEDVVNGLDEEGSGEFEVKQNLLYYFPNPDAESRSGGSYRSEMDEYNAQDPKVYETQMDDLSQSIVELNTMLKGTGSQPKIRRQLADNNIGRIMSRNSEVKTNSESYKFDAQNAQIAAKTFADFAKSPKFYRHQGDQGEAFAWHERHYGKHSNYAGDREAREYGYKMAQEFHNNKILNDALQEEKDSNVNRMRKLVAKNVFDKDNQ